MKIPMKDLEGHVVEFLRKVAETMPTSLHKWIAGAMIASSATRIQEVLGTFSDQDGMVDVDGLRKIVDEGFSASGGELVVPVGGNSVPVFNLEPVRVKITKADADGLFASIGA